MFLPQETRTPLWPAADIHDELTRYRIAVIDGFYPDKAFLVSFDKNSEERPTFAETLMLASFLEAYKDRWYTDHQQQRMAQRILDLDHYAIGHVFHKWADGDWGFSKTSWKIGRVWYVVPPAQRPYESGPMAQPHSLEQIMDRARPHDRWSEWKAAHPEVFSPESIDA